MLAACSYHVLDSDASHLCRFMVEWRGETEILLPPLRLHTLPHWDERALLDIVAQ
jgi:hypothetical protein